MANAADARPKSLSSARPALVMALAILVLSSMDALIKSFGTSLPILQIVWLRYAFGAVITVGVLLVTGPHQITLRSLKSNVVRSVFMVLTALFFFYALTRMPLVETVTLAFTAPIFMIVIARVLLGEAITSRALIAVLLGFCGVLVVVAGDFGSGGALNPLGIAGALSAAVTYATWAVLLRKHASHDSIPVLTFLQTTLAAAILTPTGVLFWSDLSQMQVLTFVAIALLGTFGHIALAWSLKHAEASRLAPIEYTNLVWASLFGLVFFAERPAPMTLAGAVLIIAACLITASPGKPLWPRRRA